MNQTQTRVNSGWQALMGVAFATLFFVQSVLGGALALTPLPLPGAPAVEVARYFTESRSAVVAVAIIQMVTAIALFVFAGSIAAVVRRMQAGEGALPRFTRAGGTLAPAFVLASALVGLVLLLVAAGGNLDLVALLRNLNFWFGGTLHVAALGVFVGAASLAGRRRNALPGWIVWLGIVTAVVSLLSLISLMAPLAALLIMLGRLLALVWSAGVGIVLAFGKQRMPATA
jgi:hypothetical protein